MNKYRSVTCMLLFSTYSLFAHTNYYNKLINSICEQVNVEEFIPAKLAS